MKDEQYKKKFWKAIAILCMLLSAFIYFAGTKIGNPPNSSSTYLLGIGIGILMRNSTLP